MTPELRPFVRSLIVAAGIATLVGSGGGFIGFPDPEFDFDGIGPFPAANMNPPRLVVQAGTPARFAVQAVNVTQPRYQWCRMPLGTTTCEPIAGATSATLALPSPTLADDGLVVQVTVTDPAGTTYSRATLFVSSAAPLPYGDGDFPATAWTVRTAAEPASGGPSAAVDTVADGGHPGAWRRIVVTVPVVPSTLRIEQWRDDAVYDPATQGAIYLIDASEDCVTPSGWTSNAYIPTVPLLVQGQRRYAAGDDWDRSCSGDSSWVAARPRLALAASDFRLLDGPACASGESCPDFGAGGAPIRFGFAQLIQTSAAGITGSRTRGIDNWSLTVWRR